MPRGLSRKIVALIALILALPALAALCGCSPSASKDLPLDPVAAKADLPPDDQILKKLDEALDLTYEKRHLSLKEHAAWQIVHGMLAFEQAFQVEDLSGQKVSALDYVLDGGAMKGWTMEPGIVLDEKTGRRGLRAVVEAGTKAGQGHSDQWLGYLADCNLKPDQTIKWGDDTYTIEDFVIQVEHDVPQNVGREYSWTLMALTTYRPTTYEWTASDGKQWSIPQLVEIEAGYDLNASPCGGGHRLCGLTMALNRHIDQGGKIEGPWKLADDKIKDSIEKARQFQNPDGALSSNYLQRPGKTTDIAISLGSSGHILEFLTLALNDEELREPWVKKAVLNMCALLKKTQDVPLECGALYHAAHGLVVYRERVFGPRTFPKS
jgi:hypothetical protein